MVKAFLTIPETYNASPGVLKDLFSPGSFCAQAFYMKLAALSFPSFLSGVPCSLSAATLNAISAAAAKISYELHNHVAPIKSPPAESAEGVCGSWLSMKLEMLAILVI
ncbi:hypothetical protein Tco_0899271 [Tanacetum coccineum]